MIFSGTVLGIEAQAAQEGRPLPLIVTKFRVNFAIAGVQPGQVVTVREWSGAWSMHRAMRSGQRMLIFLYPPSRLGLTSPVDGSAGQVALDARGEIVRTTAPDAPPLPQEATEQVDVATSGAKAQFQSSVNAALKRCSTQNPALYNAPLHNAPLHNAPLHNAPLQNAPLSADCAPATQTNITLRQLERAILDARRNSPVSPVRIPVRIKE
jgi:hypothetical protein